MVVGPAAAWRAGNEVRWRRLRRVLIFQLPGVVRLLWGQLSNWVAGGEVTVVITDSGRFRSLLSRALLVALRMVIAVSWLHLFWAMMMLAARSMVVLESRTAPIMTDVLVARQFGSASALTEP